MNVGQDKLVYGGNKYLMQYSLFSQKISNFSFRGLVPPFKNKRSPSPHLFYSSTQQSDILHLMQDENILFLLKIFIIQVTNIKIEGPQMQCRIFEYNIKINSNIFMSHHVNSFCNKSIFFGWIILLIKNMVYGWLPSKTFKIFVK